MLHLACLVMRHGWKSEASDSIPTEFLDYEKWTFHNLGGGSFESPEPPLVESLPLNYEPVLIKVNFI